LNTGRAKPPNDILDRLLIELKQVESLLAMLKGNTEPEDIEKLKRIWLYPILERIADIQAPITPNSN
jgi:hypothetical protein